MGFLYVESIRKSSFGGRSLFWALRGGADLKERENGEQEIILRYDSVERVYWTACYGKSDTLLIRP